MTAMTPATIGDNLEGLEITTEVRMFNSISRFAGRKGAVRKLTLPAGSDVAEILRRLRIPHGEVFLIFVNGRDITPSLGDVRTTYEIEDGDVVALSGPVPYSWAYGAPIV